MKKLIRFLTFGVLLFPGIVFATLGCKSLSHTIMGLINVILWAIILIGLLVLLIGLIIFLKNINY